MSPLHVEQNPVIWKGREENGRCARLHADGTPVPAWENPRATESMLRQLGQEHAKQAAQVNAAREALARSCGRTDWGRHSLADLVEAAVQRGNTSEDERDALLTDLRLRASQPPPAPAQDVRTREALSSVYYDAWRAESLRYREESGRRGWKDAAHRAALAAVVAHLSPTPPPGLREAALVSAARRIEPHLPHLDGGATRFSEHAQAAGALRDALAAYDATGGEVPPCGGCGVHACSGCSSLAPTRHTAQTPAVAPRAASPAKSLDDTLAAFNRGATRCACDDFGEGPCPAHPCTCPAVPCPACGGGTR